MAAVTWIVIMRCRRAEARVQMPQPHSSKWPWLSPPRYLASSQRRRQRRRHAKHNQQHPRYSPCTRMWMRQRQRLSWLAPRHWD